MAGPRNPEKTAWVKIAVAKAKGIEDVYLAMVAQDMGPIYFKSGSVERRNWGSPESGAENNMLHRVGMPATEDAPRALTIMGPKTVRSAPGIGKSFYCASCEMGWSMNKRVFDVRKLL